MVLLLDMALPNAAMSPAPAVVNEPSADNVSWQADVLSDAEPWQLLQRAAQLAAELGIDSEAFMEEAWSACLEARPGLREAIEDKELRSQLKKLRKRG